jgi:DNA-binding CsgD family transcriptional regulator
MARARFNYHKPRKQGFGELSKRQRQVLALTCEYGCTNVQTAALLHRSPQTVKTHLMEIKRRVRGINIAQICYEYRGWQERKR